MAGCSGATGRRWLIGVAARDLQAGQALQTDRPRLDICFWPRVTDNLLGSVFLPSGFTVAPAVAPACDDPLGVVIFQCVDTRWTLPRWRGRDGGHSEVRLCQIISRVALIQGVGAHSLLQTHHIDKLNYVLANYCNILNQFLISWKWW